MRFPKTLSVLTILSIIVPFSAVAYTDVPKDAWYNDAVEKLSDDGILDATKETFRPGALATRAEFVKLVVELNGGVLSTPTTQTFVDVPKTAWYYEYMEEAGKESWVRGENNCAGDRGCRAHPESSIARAEAAALIVRAFALEKTGTAAAFPDNPANQWYTDAIQTMADHCLMTGDGGTGNVRPLDRITRSEMAVLLYRVDRNLMSGTACGGPPPEESAASSSAAMSPPVGSRNTLAVTSREPAAYPVVRRGERNVAMLALRFTASCDDDVRIDGLVVRHIGTGSAMDLTGVYAFADDAIIADGKPDEKKLIWTMSFDPPLIITACQSGDLSFVADYSDKAQPNNFHALSIAGAQDVLSDAEKTTGDFALQGPMFEVR